MKKKSKVLMALLLCLAMLVTVTSCSNSEKDTTPTAEPEATSAATEAPKATEATTEAPTETPEPTATPEPKKITKVDGLDAYITSFEYCEEDIFGDFAEDDKIEIGSNPYALLNTGSYTLYFTDLEGSMVSVDLNEYPYISMLYRIGYGGHIGSSDHIYAIGETYSSAIPEEGKYAAQEFISDTEWHYFIFNGLEKFNTLDGNLAAVYAPANSREGEAFAIAYLGAFKTEEDATKYYEAFSTLHKDELVSAPIPKVEKQEIFLDPESSFTDTLFDFEEFSDEESMEDNVSVGLGWSTGACTSKYSGDDKNVVAYLSYDAMYYDGFVKQGTAYTLTFDFKNDGDASDFGGLLLNWGDEKNKDRDFFENNGLIKDSKGSIVGCSGLGINFIGSNEIQLYIITIETGAKLSYKAVTLPVTADLKAGFNKIVINDNGKGTITITIADELIGTVTYESPEMLGSDVTAYNERYYRVVKMYNKEGQEVLSVDNAIMSVYKSIAFGARAHGIMLDNIQVK